MRITQINQDAMIGPSYVEMCVQTTPEMRTPPLSCSKRVRNRGVPL